MSSNRSKQALFSIMTFLQFFARGAWFVTLATYLGKGLGRSGDYIGTWGSLFGIAAIVSPFFVGMVADRFFPTQRVLGVLHVAAGLLLLWVSRVTEPTAFLVLFFIYCLIYVPTEALSNAVIFHHLPRRFFPYVRAFSSIGWIAAGLAINLVLGRFVPDVEMTVYPLVMSAGASLLLGLFSLTCLPDTPIPRKGEKVTFWDIVSIDALRMMKTPSFAVFLGASLLIGIPIQMYFLFFNMFLNDIGVSHVASKLTLGQVSEAAFMFCIPWMLRRFGVKWMLAAGLILWTLRYFLFAQITVTADALILLAILMHGFCYDLFCVTGSIYVDLKAGERIRSAAQGLYLLVFLGVGKFFGSKLAGLTASCYGTTLADGTTGYDWAGMFRMTGFIVAGISLAFILLFHEKQKFDLTGS